MKKIFDILIFCKKIRDYIIYKYFYDLFISNKRKENIRTSVNLVSKDSKSDVLITFRKKGRGEERDRFNYQSKIIQFNIKGSDKVLDIGSGGFPFPYATHLADFYPDTTSHRIEPLAVDERPYIKCNIEKMPFNDREFDFTYCSHVLEHVENPKSACDEIIRISKRGYIETPTKTSDIMFNFTKLVDHHKWYVEIKNHTLIFIEYSSYERIDLGSDHFFKECHSKWDNPYQQYFFNNRTIFNNMFLWEDKFHYIIINKDGKIINTDT